MILVLEAGRLLVAANRDEQLARASAGPRLERFGDRRALAPKDLVAGGTWIGVNDRGLFAAVTNRFGRPPDPKRRSRGELVPRALGFDGRAQAIAALGGLDPREYNGFHLILADRDGIDVLRNDGDRIERHSYGPGRHVFTERSFDAAPTERAPRLRHEIAALEVVSLETLRPLLQTHMPSPLESTCVHADAIGYGTRSSTLLEVGAEYQAAEGPPCVTPFRPIAWA